MATLLTRANVKNTAALHTLIVDIVAALKGIAAKLDADGGVTDTNYAALWTDLMTNTGDAKTIDPTVT